MREQIKQYWLDSLVRNHNHEFFAMAVTLSFSRRIGCDEKEIQAIKLEMIAIQTQATKGIQK